MSVMDDSSSDTSFKFRFLYDDYKTRYGEDDDKTLEAKESLADVYLKQKRFNEASQLYDQIFRSYETILKKSNIVPINDNGPSSTFAILRQDRLNESFEKIESMYETLDEKESTSNEESDFKLNKNTNENTNNNDSDNSCIAKKLVKDKNYDEAHLILINLWNTYKNMYGPMDEKTLDVRVKIGNILYKQGKHEQCLQIFQEVYNFYSITIGTAKPKTIKAKLMVAMIYMKIGDFTNSMKLYEELHSFYGKTYGKLSLQTIIVDVLIGKNLLREGKIDKALQRYRGVHDSYSKLLGPRHHDTVEIKHIIGHVLLQKGSVVEALVVFQDVFMTYVDLYGYTDVNTLECKASLASALLLLRKFDLSLQYFQEVYEQYINLYGTVHTKTISLKNVIDDLKRASKNALNAGHDSIQQFLDRYSSSTNSSSGTTESEKKSNDTLKTTNKKPTKKNKLHKHKRERVKANVGTLVDGLINTKLDTPTYKPAVREGQLSSEGLPSRVEHSSNRLQENKPSILSIFNDKEQTELPLYGGLTQRSQNKELPSYRRGISQRYQNTELPLYGGSIQRNQNTELPLYGSSTQRTQNKSTNAKSCYKIKPITRTLSMENLVSTSETNMSYSTLDLRQSRRTKKLASMPGIRESDDSVSGSSNINSDLVKSSSMSSLPTSKDFMSYKPLKRSNSVSTLSSFSRVRNATRNKFLISSSASNLVKVPVKTGPDDFRTKKTTDKKKEHTHHSSLQVSRQKLLGTNSELSDDSFFHLSSDSYRSFKRGSYKSSSSDKLKKEYNLPVHDMNKNKKRKRRYREKKKEKDIEYHIKKIKEYKRKMKHKEEKKSKKKSGLFSSSSEKSIDDSLSSLRIECSDSSDSSACSIRYSKVENSSGLLETSINEQRSRNILENTFFSSNDNLIEGDTLQEPKYTMQDGKSFDILNDVKYNLNEGKIVEYDHDVLSSKFCTDDKLAHISKNYDNRLKEIIQRNNYNDTNMRSNQNGIQDTCSVAMRNQQEDEARKNIFLTKNTKPMTDFPAPTRLECICGSVTRSPSSENIFSNRNETSTYRYATQKQTNSTETSLTTKSLDSQQPNQAHESLKDSFLFNNPATKSSQWREDNSHLSKSTNQIQPNYAPYPSSTTQISNNLNFPETTNQMNATQANPFVNNRTNSHPLEEMPYTREIMAPEKPFPTTTETSTHYDVKTSSSYHSNESQNICYNRNYNERRHDESNNTTNIDAEQNNIGNRGNRGILKNSFHENDPMGVPVEPVQKFSYNLTSTTISRNNRDKSFSNQSKDDDCVNVFSNAAKQSLSADNDTNISKKNEYSNDGITNLVQLNGFYQNEHSNSLKKLSPSQNMKYNSDKTDQKTFEYDQELSSNSSHMDDVSQKEVVANNDQIVAVNNGHKRVPTKPPRKFSSNGNSEGQNGVANDSNNVLQFNGKNVYPVKPGSQVFSYGNNTENINKNDTKRLGTNFNNSPTKEREMQQPYSGTNSDNSPLRQTELSSYSANNSDYSPLRNTARRYSNSSPVRKVELGTDYSDNIEDQKSLHDPILNDEMRQSKSSEASTGEFQKYIRPPSLYSENEERRPKFCQVPSKEDSNKSRKIDVAESSIENKGRRNSINLKYTINTSLQNRTKESNDGTNERLKRPEMFRKQNKNNVDVGDSDNETGQFEIHNDVVHSYDSVDSSSPILEKPLKRKIRTKKRSRSVSSVHILDETQTTNIEDTPEHNYSENSNCTVIENSNHNNTSFDTFSNVTDISDKSPSSRKIERNRMDSIITDGHSGDNGQFNFANRYFASNQKQGQLINTTLDDSDPIELWDRWDDTSSTPYMHKSELYKRLEEKYKLIDGSSFKKKAGKNKLLKIFCF